MSLRVLYFASLKDRTGTAEETLDVPEAGTVEELWSRLVALHPALGSLRVRPMVACDRAYARWDASLVGVAEVAFLPPVSGG